MRRPSYTLCIVLAAFLIVTCFVGSVAYFTDQASVDAELSTMKNAIGIVPEPDPDAVPDDPNKDPEDYKDPSPEDPTDDLTNWWLYLNSVAKVNYNPGDKMDLSYILTNTGKLDVKIRETFVIQSTVPLTEGAEEFKLCTSYAPAPAGGVEAAQTEGMTFETLSDTKYKVTIDGSELAVSESAGKNYYLVFAPLSGNEFQGVNCTISYVVEAIQANGDWHTVVTGELVLNDHAFDVVPAA